MTRRVGTTTSKTRAVLLDVTLQIMVEDGYAAVSSRRVAAMAGVKAPLIHYYFPTLDDLFIAALHHNADRLLEKLTVSLQAENPLPAIWKFVNDKAGAALTLEFLALANHRKAISAEIAEVSERFRKLEIDAMTRFLATTGLDTDRYPPDGLLFVMASVPTLAGLEAQLGISLGHDAALGLVGRQLAELQQAGKPTGRPAPRTRRSR